MTGTGRTRHSRFKLMGIAALCLGAGIAAFGLSATPADAQWWGGNRGDYHHNWNGGYRRAPPVVYGSTYRSSYYGYRGAPYNGTTYYYAPPLVYGPSVVFPGVSIQLQ